MSHSNVAVEVSSEETLIVPLVTNVDPGSVTIEIAFEDEGSLSATPTWYATTIDPSGDQFTFEYTSGLLAKGTYYWFVRITEPPGIPIERGRNRLVIY